MSAHDPASPRKFDRQAWFVIDELCDRYENTWSATQFHQINDFLGLVDQPLRPQLLHELLLIELELRQKSGAPCSLDDLARRFPEHAAAIGELHFHDAEGARGRRVVAQRRLGQYDLLEPVGQGAAGTVWRAHDWLLGRVVAVKVPHDDAGGIEVHRKFRREARIAACLKHPNIVRVLQVSAPNEPAYIVSEFIEGASLARWPGRARLSFRKMARLCLKIARALRYAHEQNVVHRDLTPGNIIIDSSGEPHLTDFGMAKEAGTFRTANGKVFGTPAYMSPEQAAGNVPGIGPQTDVYSLGVILYELLTGRLPFEQQLPAVLHAIQTLEPARPRALNASIPRDLEQICLQAMAKDLRVRYAGAAELAEDLERFLAGERVVASGKGWARRLWARARRRFFTAARLASLALTVGISVLLTLAITRQLTPASPHVPLRRVAITTEPAGARLAIAPIDEETGLPIAEKVLRPSQRTPALVDLPQGYYLVVADLPGHGFHEVYRTVPKEGEKGAALAYSSNWTVGPDGIIRLPPIKIPDSSITDKLVRFEGGQLIMGDARWPNCTPHVVQVDSFYLAPLELTIGELLRLDDNWTNGSERDLSRNTTEPVVGLSYREALIVSELAGMRLPTEAEYEFAATNRGRTAFPWGDNPELISDWTFGAVGSPEFDKTQTDPPVHGLFSNVAEWTDSRMRPFAGSPALSLPAFAGTGAHQTLVVRGGPYSVLARAPKQAECLLGPRWRHGVVETSKYPGLGFRCARSARPRFLD